MAASRRGQPPLSVRLPSGTSPAVLPDLPPISALFLIDFDVKAGYTIIWKQAVEGLDLEGVVEYKSLPSGLHTVPEDLIYFTHDDGYAGLSAFVNTRTDEEAARHARMIAVGVLVPLSYGRLGRAWRHAEGLKSMAAQLVADRKQTQILEQYWEKTRARDGSAQQPVRDSPLGSPSVSFKSARPPAGRGHTRNRSASDGTVLIPPGHRLSPFHPAWSLTDLLETFGPLIFPIHRAALLRKRVLISTHAPVHDVCNFVYDISVLANIPLSVFDLLDQTAPAQRLRPLFNIGVHDIPFLTEDSAAAKGNASAVVDEGNARDDYGSGWVACTTDSILAVKSELWDMLITMPPSYAANAQEKVWPTVEYPKGVVVRATQRDLRRFRTLKVGLRRLATPHAIAASFGGDSGPQAETEPPPPRTAGHRRSTSSGTAGGSLFPSSDNNQDESLLADAAEKIVEPMTWAALAYSGFMWWASAGEQRRSDEADETAHDSALLADLGPTPSTAAAPAHRNVSVTAVGMLDSITSLAARPAGDDGEGGDDEEEERAKAELAIIAYFHRLTTQMLSVLADIVESSDDEDDEDDMLDVGEEEDVLLRPGNNDGESSSGSRVRISSGALARMGLDVWSEADVRFVKDLVTTYFARRAYVEGKGVEVCGLRVC